MKDTELVTSAINKMLKSLEENMIARSRISILERKIKGFEELLKVRYNDSYDEGKPPYYQKKRKKKKGKRCKWKN